MNFAEHRRIRAEHWGIEGLVMRPFDIGLATRSATAVNIGILNRGNRSSCPATIAPISTPTGSARCSATGGACGGHRRRPAGAADHV